LQVEWPTEFQMPGKHKGARAQDDNHDIIVIVRMRRSM